VVRLAVRRTGQLVVVVFGLSVLLYAWLLNLPGGPEAALLGERGTPQLRARLREQLGLDDPFWVQYARFLGRALTGNFGASLQSGRSVTTEFAERFPATIELTVAALIFAVGFGIPLGYVAARRRGSVIDSGSVVLSLLGVCTPVFFLAFILKYVFAETLGWFPSFGRQSSDVDATRVTGFFVLDGLLTREWDASLDATYHLVLPAIALGSIPLAIIVRITRASVLEVLGEDYVRTAESKGLLSRTIRNRHVLRNAMLPVSTTIGLQTGLLLSGAVLTERVFAWNGVGSFLADSISNRDYPVLLFFIMGIAVVFVIVNLAVDLSYGLIDPRVRVR
jgi:peptide/nickel transport system permease protein